MMILKMLNKYSIIDSTNYITRLEHDVDLYQRVSNDLLN